MPVTTDLAPKSRKIIREFLGFFLSARLLLYVVFSKAFKFYHFVGTSSRPAIQYVNHTGITTARAIFLNFPKKRYSRKIVFFVRNAAEFYLART